MKTNRLEEFARRLIKIRERKGLSQGALCKLVQEKIGVNCLSGKIISRWETGMLKGTRKNHHSIVKAIDDILGAEGELYHLYHAGVPEVKVVYESITVTHKHIPLMIEISKLLSSDLDPKFSASLLEGLIEFFIRTGLPVSDTEYHRGLIHSAIMIARSAKENQKQKEIE